MFIPSILDFVRDETIKWIDKHYPNLFEDVILTNSFSEGEGILKAELCKRLGIPVLIDDSPFEIKSCHRYGIISILYSPPDYRYNKDLKMNGLLIASSWIEIEEILEKIRFHQLRLF